MHTSYNYILIHQAYTQDVLAQYKMCMILLIHQACAWILIKHSPSCACTHGFLLAMCANVHYYKLNVMIQNVHESCAWIGININVHECAWSVYFLTIIWSDQTRCCGFGPCMSARQPLHVAMPTALAGVRTDSASFALRYRVGSCFTTFSS